MLFQGCASLRINKALKGEAFGKETLIKKIPFEYDMDLIVVPVLVNRESLKFIIDTGVPTVLSEGVRKRLILGKKEQIEAEGFHASSRIPLEVIEIDEIRLGGLSVKKMGAFSTPALSKGSLQFAGIDGILDANFMWEFI